MTNYNNTIIFLKKNIIYIIPLIIVISGIIILLFTTKHGVGTSPDSAIYINVADQIIKNQNIGYLANEGEIIPMVHYPPLYPVILSTFSFIGMGPMQAAKFLNIFIFISIILLVTFIIYRLTKSIFLSIFGALIILTSRTLLLIHVMAWTEPLFILFLTLGMFFLFIYLEKQKKLFLIISALLFSIAFLTRYSGIAFLAGGIISLFFLQKEKKFLNKLYDITQFSIIICLPMMLWMMRNLNTGSTLTNRKIEFHLISQEHVLSGLQTLTLWVLNTNFNFFFSLIFFLIFLILLTLGIIYINKNINKLQINLWHQQTKKFINLLLIFILIYIVHLIFSISFADFATPMNYRILSPIYIPIMLIILFTVYFIYLIKKSTYALCSITAFIFIYLILSLTVYINYILAGNIYGIGFSSLAWKNSEIMEYVKSIPNSKPIFSNGADAIYLNTKKPAYTIPRFILTINRKNNENYLQNLKDMEDKLKNKNGVIVYYNNINWRSYLISEEEFSQFTYLYVVKKWPEGTIYGVKK